MANFNVTAFIVLVVAATLTSVSGQGLGLARSSTVGASSTLSQLQQLYSGSQAWKRAYKQNPKAACSKGGRGSLCAASSTDDATTYAQLMLATSPQAYSSTSSGAAVQLVAPAQDQQQCLTCAAFAVAAAAETAMASVLQVDVRQCSISVQALYSCPPGRPTRSCSAGWNLQDALEQLQQRGQSLPTTACLPYTPDFRAQLTAAQLCTSSCSTPSQHASRGQFSSKQITSIWEAQQHIRRYGAVVSRFDVRSDFGRFFADKRNAKAVYKPSAGAVFEFGHAIVLVGYNNEERYWLAKNSYGSSWADGGLFRVAYGACSVLTPETGEAYGIIWTPNQPEDTQKLQPLQKGPKPNCYYYKAQPRDYLSRVAWLEGVPLEQLLLDNAAVIKDLDTALNGTRLLLCNPQRGATAASAAKADPQLEALMRIQQAVDTTGVLHTWSRTTGAGGGYCRWPGVLCRGGSAVAAIKLYEGVGVVGLQGSLPSAAAVAGLDKLVELAFVGQPGITGTLPADWSNLTKLQYIQLKATSLTGSIPASWGNLAQLSMLDLAGNALTSTLPASLGNLKQLDMLSVRQNQLEGSIPAALGSCKALSTLGLGSNKLNGSLPDTMQGLTALEQLYANDNALSGALPAWLGSLNNLQVLNLENNKFKGSIPAALVVASKLKELGLGRNQLSGTLPDAWKQLTGLQQLSVLSNNLTGSVPSSWGSLKALSGVFMSDNPLLGGCLPAAWFPQLGNSPYRQNVLRGTKISGFC
uniref:Peptidase C1A papain C-terminal domain-containing protein n=1 Tax=Tetradesmus obliquus TaxID=3088 RepID=A0A383VH09_TETOB|eukprot:jgi/Sobl393_1/18446/SZX64223.1